jgi:hypothetical protein
MAKQLAIEVFFVALIGLVLGMIGPFGTYAVPEATRIAYWVIFGIVGYAIFRPLTIVGGWLSEALNITPMIGIGFALVLAALPMTVIVAAILFRFDMQQALQWRGLGGLYFQVWLIGFLTNGFFTLVFRRDSPPVTPDGSAAIEPAISGPAVDRFADRLPAGFGPLLALKGEDHYVRAIGTTGEELVLIRLRDAIAELGDDHDGLQVHRSWWVARDALATIVRNGRTATLSLASGHQVPVAREKLPILRDAGWMKR